MTVVIYRSSDGSAPVLNGTAGSLITVLDAILVNGYTGKAAAGWTKSFSGTNAASYRQAAGNQFYIDVVDTGAQTATGKEANVRGYEVMTALTTGTNLFPTTAQTAAPGMNVRKSATADSTARAWVCAADDRTFMLFIFSGDNANQYTSLIFGDIYSLKSADSYRTIIMARTTANSSNAGDDSADRLSSAFSTVTNGHYMARRADATVGSNQVAKIGISSSSNLGSGTVNVPALDSNIYMSRFLVGGNNDNGIRGWLRGLFMVIGNTGLNDGDTFSGAAGSELSSKSFVVLAKGGNGGVMALETSNTWDTSS